MQLIFRCEGQRRRGSRLWLLCLEILLVKFSRAGIFSQSFGEKACSDILGKLNRIGGGKYEIYHILTPQFPITTRHAFETLLMHAELNHSRCGKEERRTIECDTENPILWFSCSRLASPPAKQQGHPYKCPD